MIIKNTQSTFKKTAANLIIVFLVSSFLISNVFAASFNDVSKTNKYFTAINFLADHGVINGYPDGTFQPNKNVSRVEFLKILLESSNVKTDITAPSGFKDVDETAWYAKYIRKAKQEGWVQGYGDNTFKPEQGVNKVEALKIAAKVQNWNVKSKLFSAPYNDVATNSWYAPFVDYAKTNNFLEETGRFYIPDAILSRGQVSEILFRISVTTLTKAAAYSPALLKSLPAVSPSTVQNPDSQPVTAPDNNIPNPPAETTPDLNFTPVTFQTYQANFFNGVTLKSSFPNTFYLNEIYNFEGNISAGNYNEAFVFLAPDGSNNPDSYLHFTTGVSNGYFKIPVIFRQPGNYKLGLILGSSGESKIVSISVLPALPEPKSNQSMAVPGIPDINYQNQSTAVTWAGGDSSTLSKVIIYQGSVSKQFISRQNLNKLTLDYSDFKNFSAGKTYLQLKQARMENSTPLQINSSWTASPVKTFTSTTHQFNLIDKDAITVSTVPGILNSLSPINFSGTVKINTFQKAAVIKPDGSVENFNLSTTSKLSDHFGSPVIPAGGNFIFNYTPKTSGTYIIEINNQDGEATLNTGIYVNSGIPLIPDFFDFDHTSDKEPNFNLSNGRTQLLNLINQERQKTGLKPVVLDNDLNILAQKHTDDMLSRNFFGHVNPDGQTPDDRRKALNIPTLVGENLARSTTIIYAHNGLMQSAIHRQNILDPKWTRVGIGLTKSNDYILTAEEFSTFPLSDSDLSGFKSSLISQINNKRIQQNLSQLSSDTKLENIATDWSQKMIDENFFDFVSPNGASLSSNISVQIPNKSVQALILSSNSLDKLNEQILNGTDTVNSKWSFIGIGIKTDKLGTIKATLLYTTS